MGARGLDFKHKEVVNIADGRRLRLCARCNCRFGKWYYYIHNGALIENRWDRFVFERRLMRKGYTTMIGEKRTGYVVKDKFVYDVVCKVEI